MAPHWTDVSNLQTLVIECSEAVSDFLQLQIAGRDVSVLRGIHTEVNKLRGTIKFDVLPEAVVAFSISLLDHIFPSLSRSSTPSSLQDLLAAAAFTLIAALELHLRVVTCGLRPRTVKTVELLTDSGVARCGTWVCALQHIEALRGLPGSLPAQFIDLSLTSFCRLLHLTACIPRLLDRLSHDLDSTEIISHMSSFVPQPPEPRPNIQCHGARHSVP